MQKFTITNSVLWQLIATAALFLAAKSEETLQPLNDVLRASCEIFHNQELTYLSFMLSVVSIFPILPFLFVFIPPSEKGRKRGKNTD